MRILPLPSLRAAAPIALRAATPRADILEDLKYQLSNADEGTRPARDVVENPVAFAYIIVLALLGGGLAYLLFLDTQASARNKAALEEQERAVAMMREQGLEAEAAVLEKDLKKERRAAKPKPEQPKGLAADPEGMSPDANRFERRQGRAAKKAKKSKSKKRR